MKKIILLIFAIMLCFCFAACDPHGGEFEDLFDDKEITSIQLIDYDNPDQLPIQTGLIAVFSRQPDPASFKNDKCTILGTLDEDKKEEFIEKISGLSWTSGWGNHYDSPKGLCLKFTYSNGNFLIINIVERGFIGEYAADGTLSYYCFLDDKESISSIIGDYFDYRISS